MVFMKYLINQTEGGAWACESRARFKRLVFQAHFPSGSAVGGNGEEYCRIRTKCIFGKGV